MEKRKGQKKKIMEKRKLNERKKTSLMEDTAEKDRIWLQDLIGAFQSCFVLQTKDYCYYLKNHAIE